MALFIFFKKFQFCFSHLGLQVQIHLEFIWGYDIRWGSLIFPGYKESVVSYALIPCPLFHTLGSHICMFRPYFLFFKIYLLTYLRAQSLSHVQLFVTLWTIACQPPLSMGFPRQECMYVCMYVFLTALGLHCYARAFSSCSVGYSPLQYTGFSYG